MSKGPSSKNTEQEPATTAPGQPAAATPARQAWVAPKLTFVEPKLTKHGPLTEVTGAFFGGFSPGT